MQALNKKTTGEDLAAFQTIVDFVTNLHNYFETKIHSIALYHRLIYQKSFQDDELILRHVNIFRNYCKDNREALKERDENKFNSKRISFSDRIYIDLEYIFSHVDAETKKIVWEYLLAISAHVDPQNNTKEILRQLQTAPAASSQPAFNPMEMLGGMMGNPMLGGMMATLQQSLTNGNIDLAKLVSSITPIVENVKKEIEQSDDPNIKNMIQMIQGAVGGSEPAEENKSLSDKMGVD